MEIKGKELGKKFSKKWVFQNLNIHIAQNENIAILGPNGSGKSTLLKILSSAMLPDKGSIFWFHEGQQLEPENVFQHINFATPYISLIEDFNLIECLKFHQKFKAFPENWDPEKLASYAGLENASAKALKQYSSGMKQKVKLLLALASQSSLVLLDEPCSHLDTKAMEWYLQLIADFGKQKTIVICSNHQKQEYSFCSQSIMLNSV